MKPVFQKIISADIGDCFSACIASILEASFDVPNFHSDEHSSWLMKWNNWLEPINLQLVWFPFGFEPMPNGYAILSVSSALFPEMTHAVVWYQGKDGKGKIIHNPNPSDPRRNNISFDDYRLIYVLGVLDPSKSVGVSAMQDTET